MPIDYLNDRTRAFIIKQDRTFTPYPTDTPDGYNAYVKEAYVNYNNKKLGGVGVVEIKKTPQIFDYDAAEEYLTRLHNYACDPANWRIHKNTHFGLMLELRFPESERVRASCCVSPKVAGMIDAENEAAGVEEKLINVIAEEFQSWKP